VRSDGSFSSSTLEIPVAEGESSFTFYFHDALEGTLAITAEAPLLPGWHRCLQQLRVVKQGPSLTSN
jgi:hypothetical protein